MSLSDYQWGYNKITNTSGSPFQVGDKVYDRVSRSIQTVTEVEVLKWRRKWPDGSDESHFFKVGDKRAKRDIFDIKRV